MNTFTAQATILAVLLSFVGCAEQQESTVINSSGEATDTENALLGKQPEEAVHHNHHHGHQHAFADPDELAKKWNDPSRDKWQHPDEIVAALNLKDGATVADVGAGTGYMVAHLSQAVGKSGTVIAIDAEAAMIEYLTKHEPQLGPATIVPQKVGFSDPELNVVSVDGVLILDTWHHMNGRESYAKKVYDSLKQGGRFVIVDYTADAEAGPPKSMRLDPSAVVSQLDSVGFRAEVLNESMPKHFMVVGHKN